MSDHERINELERRVEQLERMLSANPRKTYMQDVVRHRLKDALPALMAKHPTGVTTKHVAEHFGVSVATTTIALRDLKKKGRIQWAERKGTHERCVLPLGAPIPPLGLTKAQSNLLMEIERLAENGVATVSVRFLAKELRLNPGTVTYTIGRLVGLGRLSVAKRSADWKATTYVVNRTPSDADIHRAAFYGAP